MNGHPLVIPKPQAEESAFLLGRKESRFLAPNGMTSSKSRVFVQPARRPLRHFVTYGSTNKYRPVTRSKASGNTAMRPTPPLYFFSAMATILMITATVKAMDSQRWICRTHLFQLNGTLAAAAGFCAVDSMLLLVFLVVGVA